MFLCMMNIYLFLNIFHNLKHYRQNKYYQPLCNTHPYMYYIELEQQPHNFYNFYLYIMYMIEELYQYHLKRSQTCKHYINLNLFYKKDNYQLQLILNNYKYYLHNNHSYILCIHQNYILNNYYLSIMYKLQHSPFRIYLYMQNIHFFKKYMFNNQQYFKKGMLYHYYKNQFYNYHIMKQLNIIDSWCLCKLYICYYSSRILQNMYYMLQPRYYQLYNYYNYLLSMKHITWMDLIHMVLNIGYIHFSLTYYHKNNYYNKDLQQLLDQ